MAMARSPVKTDEKITSANDAVEQAKKAADKAKNEERFAMCVAIAKSFTDDEKKIATYAEKLKPYLEQTLYSAPLERHLWPFLDENKNFTPALVSAVLARMHSSGSYLKGRAIAFFNATHALNCPAMSAQFKKDPVKGYADFLHMGTTRVWNEKGDVVAANYQAFTRATVTDDKDLGKIIPVDKLKAYLNGPCANMPQDPTNGRHADHMGQYTWQTTAATAAWGEVIDRCTVKADKIAYFTPEQAKLFFEEGAALFLMAECEILPAEKLRPKQANKL